MSQNLLKNPSFADGVRPVQSPFVSGAWPVDWELDWYYKPEDRILGTGSAWALPEMIVIEHIKQFPEDSHRFDKSDPFIFKCFWNGAVGFGWKQTLDLPAGQYVFDVPVKPDHWHEISEGNLVRPSPQTSDDWYLASEVYARIDSAGSSWETGWHDARTAPIGEYTVLTVEYIHPGGPMTVSFGARGRWPFRNDGWFFDGLSLERVGISVPPPVPSPSPVKAELAQLRLRIDALTGALNARRENALAVLDVLRYSARKMADELDAAYEEAQRLGEL